MTSQSIRTRTADLTSDQADSTKELLEEVWEAVDNQGQYEDQDAQEYLDEMPLEVVYEKGEPFAVVLGTGGPHVEIVGGGREGGYKLAVYWGSWQAFRTGEAITRTGEYFREMYEEMG